MWITFFYTLTFLVLTVFGQCHFDTRCFRWSSGYALMNANPYDRSTPISCSDCLKKCLQQQGYGPMSCRAAVYDSRYQSCDLFAVNAMMRGYRLTRVYGRCYFQPTGCCRGGGGNTPAPTPAPAMACPAGMTAKLVAIKDYSYPGLSGTTVPNVDANGCAQACVKNQLPNGTPIDCKAAQFNAGTCTISTTAGSNVEGAVQPSPGSTYYQKICFPTGSVVNCPDVFEEDPQKILIGQNRQTVDSPSFQDCMNQCLNSQATYGFVCKSGIFFYTQTTLNCILNVESKSTKPDLFTDAQGGDQVTYFEPGCNGGQKLAIVAFDKSTKSRDLPITVDGEWTMWSPCDTSNKQYRYMQCEKTDPRQCEKQQKTCGGMKTLTFDETAITQESQGINSIHDGNATNTFTPCKAFFKNGNKNCTFGTQHVDGDVIYCQEPIDC